jgi:hypothetical protein
MFLLFERGLFTLGKNREFREFILMIRFGFVMGVPIFYSHRHKFFAYADVNEYRHVPDNKRAKRQI